MCSEIVEELTQESKESFNKIEQQKIESLDSNSKII